MNEQYKYLNEERLGDYMKRLILLFILIGTMCFGANLTNVTSSGAKLSFAFSGSDKAKVNSSFDNHNRLLFLEFSNTNLTSKLNEKACLSKYVESFESVNYGDSVGFFIKLKKNTSYSTSYNGNDFVISFNESGKKQFTIAIDAGHGGKDPGAIGFSKYYEKTVVLAVAKYLKEELGEEYNIIMTRESDVFIPLGDRPRKANNGKADMFISVHANSAPTNSLNGVEVFYFSKKSSPYAERIAAFENSVGDKYGEKSGNIVQIMGELAYKKNQEISIGLAKEVVNNISRGIGLKNRGVHGANFAVLRGFNGPSILVEIGFINNEGDLEKIWRESNQKQIAREIAKMVRANF